MTMARLPIRVQTARDRTPRGARPSASRHTPATRTTSSVLSPTDYMERMHAQHEREQARSSLVPIVHRRVRLCRQGGASRAASSASIPAARLSRWDCLPAQAARRSRWHSISGVRTLDARRDRARRTNATLLPFSRIWSSLVTRFPSDVISLRRWHRHTQR